MPVQAVYKFTEENDDRRIVAGKVESGKISVGDAVIFLPSNKRSEVKSIERFNAPVAVQAEAGYSTGFTLKEQIYINRGDIMCKVGEPHPLVSSLLKVEIFWMGKNPMTLGKEYKLKLGTAKVPVTLKEIRKIIDASDLKQQTEKKAVERHDVAECVLECASPVAFDTASDIEATGRFVIVDQYDIAGGGIIIEMLKDEQADVREQVTLREEKWDFSVVDPETRTKTYGHRPKLILLTGKVGVDKKSIAKELERHLFETGCKTYFLGIGNLLRGLDADLERQKAARREHVRRLGEVSHLMMDAGLLVLATASNLNDDELRLLQEITSRDMILIVNVGANDFRQGIVDLNLDPAQSIQDNVRLTLNLMETSGIFLRV